MGSAPAPSQAGEPAKKRAKLSFREMYAGHQMGMGEAPTPAQLSTRSHGTDCYAIVVSKPDAKGHNLTDENGKPTGAQFQVTSVRVILGTPDMAKNILIDEKEKQVVFTIPEVDAYMAAMKQRRKSGSTEFVKVDKTEERLVNLFQVHKVTVKQMFGFEGVEFPCVVRLVGLTCSGARAKVKENGKYLKDENGEQVYSDRIFYDLNATNVVPLETVGRDPTKVIRYLESCGVMSNWHHEEPFVSDEDLANNQHRAGKNPLVIPIVRKDDAETAEQMFGQYATVERGFMATVRPEKTLDVRNYFYLSKPERNKYQGQSAGGKNSDVKMPDASEAKLGRCDVFSVCAKWSLAITQWDKSVHPDMSCKDALRYEVEVAAFGESLWSAGLSHPQHWAVFRYHLPFIGGVLLCQEDRSGTCGAQGNVSRHHIMKTAKPGSPESLGFASPLTPEELEMQRKNPYSVPPRPNMRQIVKAWSRGVILDVPGYLRKYGLRCSFATAIFLLGMPKKDATDQERPLMHTGKYGVEKTMVRDGKIETVKDVHLKFNPEGFVCLSALPEQQSLRALNQRIDQYYVLTTLSPRLERVQGDLTGENLTAMKNAAIQAAVVPRIQDDEVIAICKEACKTYPQKVALEKQAMQPDASDSLKAVGKWLAAAALGDENYADDLVTPSYLVFATYKDGAEFSEFLKDRSEASFQTTVRGWTQGPSCALSVAPIRVNAPNMDPIDEALCEPDAATSEDVKQEEEPEEEASGDSSDDEGDENMIQATQDYADDDDDDEDQDMTDTGED